MVALLYVERFSLQQTSFRRILRTLKSFRKCDNWDGKSSNIWIEMNYINKRVLRNVGNGFVCGADFEFQLPIISQNISKAEQYSALETNRIIDTDNQVPKVWMVASITCENRRCCYIEMVLFVLHKRHWIAENYSEEDTTLSTV